MAAASPSAAVEDAQAQPRTAAAAEAPVAPAAVKEAPAAPAAQMSQLSLADRMSAYTNRASASSNTPASAASPAPAASSGGGGAARARFGGSSAPKCPKCGRSVYPADPKIAVKGETYHKGCFKCEDCKRSLGLSDFTFAGRTLLCKTHYFQRFQETNAYGGEEDFAHAGSTANRGTAK